MRIDTSPGRNTRGVVAILALMALAWSAPIVRAETVPGLVIDGETIVTPGHAPERRGDVWLVPTRPIAQTLGATVVFESYSRSVSVSIPSQGVTAYYDGLTGEVSRDFAIGSRLAPGLPVGTHEGDLRVPIELASILFGVTIRVDALTDALIVTSNPLDPEQLRAELPAIGVQEVRYHGNAVERGDVVNGALTLENRTRVRTGLLSTRLDGRYTDAQHAHLNTFLTQLDSGAGSRVMLGDLRGDTRMSWLRAHGRGIGADLELNGGARRLSASYVQLSSGFTGARSNFVGPRFDEHVGTVSMGWRLRDEPTAADALDVGASWIGRGASRREGMLVGVRHEARRERWLTRVEGGAFVSPGHDLADREAIELHAQWSPEDDTALRVRAGHFGTAFQRASVFAEDGSSFYTLGANRRLSERVSLGASHSLHYDPVLRSTDRLYDAATAWTPSHPALQSAVATLSIADLGRTSTRTDLSLDLRGRLPIGKWYGSMRRRLSGSDAFFASAGLLVDTRAGRAQLATSWSDHRFAGASADWSPPVRMLGGLSMTVGGRWTRTFVDEQRGFTARIRIGYASGDHGASIAVDQQQVGHLTRADWRGRFVLDEDRLRHAGMDDAAGRNRPVAIEGRIYVDTNLNGRYDEGERPLRGIVVTLDRGMDRRETDREGRYAFESLAPGRHHVTVEATTLRADLSVLGALSGDVTIGPLTRARIDFRACVNRRVTGIVFVDVNGNDRHDTDEPVVSDALVFIAGGSNTLSSPDGSFRLGDVPPGRHALQIAPASLPGELIAPATMQVDVPVTRDVTGIQVGVVPRPRAVVRKRF